MHFTLKDPCANCPFRTDKPHQQRWLGRARAEDICSSLIDKQQTFQCHKTLDLTEDKHQHCAGAMIMLEHMNSPNQMMRIAERVGMYDSTAINMSAPVFTDSEDFIEFHSEDL